LAIHWPYVNVTANPTQTGKYISVLPNCTGNFVPIPLSYTNVTPNPYGNLVILYIDVTAFVYGNFVPNPLGPYNQCTATQEPTQKVLCDAVLTNSIGEKVAEWAQRKCNKTIYRIWIASRTVLGLLDPNRNPTM